MEDAKTPTPACGKKRTFLQRIFCCAKGIDSSAEESKKNRKCAVQCLTKKQSEFNI
jgi:hypothetical protein